MDVLHEGQELDTSAGLCNRAGQSIVAAAERVSGGRESNPASTPANSIAAHRSGEVHVSGNRQTPRPKSAETSSARRQAGYDPRLVRKAHS